MKRVQHAIKKKVFLWFEHQGPSDSDSFFLVVCVDVHQCTDVFVILSCCWQALKSEFHIKSRRWFDTDRNTEANSTMPKLFTRPDSTWPTQDNVRRRRKWMNISWATISQKVRIQGRGNHKSKAIELVGTKGGWAAD